MKFESRFATKEEIFSDDFKIINNRLLDINKHCNLSDHTEINLARFPWSVGKFHRPAVYVSRMWEYPFAILSSQVTQGMKCADVGCGTSPFTLYLAEVTGRNCVTGFDPDEIIDSTRHSTFGANRSLLNSYGVNYKKNNMTNIEAEPESFDRVFCISVIEHIVDPEVWQKGIREMVRILKPGGRLIITVDLGIDLPLINIFDIIKYSGLNLMGTLNYSWPINRFLVLDNKPLDVFGLILKKNDERIFSDFSQQNELRQFEANKKFIPSFTSLRQLQIGKDLVSKNGTWRVLAKLLLRKYN